MAAAAHVITVGLDLTLNRSIRGWFRQFNHLPPIPLTAGKIETVSPHDASFTRLLTLMADSPHRNFILIIHGHSDGSGLWLKLTPRQAHPHTTFQDLRRLMELDDGGPELDRADRATMGVSGRETHQILDLMHKVQAKTIDCIEFRACNLGRNPSSLDRFRRFFGARRAGAPDIHSFFGLVPALADARLLQTHERAHTGHNWETYKFPSAYKDPTLVCCFELNRLSKPEYGGHIVADSAATLDGWIKQYIMRDGSAAGREMAMHGLWIADIEILPKTAKEHVRYVPAAVDSDSEQLASPLGGWGGPIVRRFVPPLAEGYAKHIVYAK